MPLAELQGEGTAEIKHYKKIPWVSSNQTVVPGHENGRL